MLICTPKIVLINFCLLFTFICVGQKPTTLSGKIYGLDSGSKVYLSQTAKTEMLDSFTVTKDSFYFKINIFKGDAYFLKYSVNSEIFASPVYLQKGSPDIYVSSIKNTARLSFSGYDLADEQNNFYKRLSVISKPGNDLENEIAKTKDSALLNKLNIEKKKNLSDTREFFEAWLKSHNNSPFSVGVIKFFMEYAYSNTEDLERLYNSLSQKARQDNLLVDDMPLFFGRMKENEILKSGEWINNFILHDTTGIAHSFFDLKGDNYVLLDVWASWCGPCRKSTPEISKLLDTYKKYNFKVISIYADTDSEEWKDAITKDKMYRTQLSDLKGETMVL